jgi:hypothetical protein
MSIEVLDGEFPAWLWREAHGDSLVEAALRCDVVEWRWHQFAWGTVLELDFVDESAWERFRESTAVQAALDAVPNRFSGLLIYRGRGGASAPREPRSPLPIAGGRRDGHGVSRRLGLRACRRHPADNPRRPGHPRLIGPYTPRPGRRQRCSPSSGERPRHQIVLLSARAGQHSSGAMSFDSSCQA